VACLIKYIPNASWETVLFCSGTFISTTHVLTAEHCSNGLATSPIQVALKARNMEYGVRFNPIWWLSYEQWMNNLGRVFNSVVNDILIIKVNYLYYIFNCIIITICIDNYIHFQIILKYKKYFS
jgi:secreted trypsin-like serine protease